MCWRAYSVCFFFYKIRLNAGSRVFSGRRYCESIHVGEALASQSGLKPLPHHIKTIADKIQKLFYV
jgi:hypothetical protein